MALVIKDRVRETSQTTGTGTYSLDGAEVGFETFSGSVGNGNTCPYVAVFGANWEVGIGTVAAGTLARTTILASSNGDTAVSWATGVKQVRLGIPAALLPLLEGGNEFKGTQIVRSSTSDVAIEARTDGDFTPRITWRKANAVTQIERVYQSRIDASGDWLLRDVTADVDRLEIDTAGAVKPGADATQSIGATALRWLDLFLAGVLRLKASTSREIDIECQGDGSQPSYRIRKTGVTADTAAEYTINIDTSGRLRISNITAGNVPFMISTGGHPVPGADNVFTSGNAANRWSAVHAANGTIQTSDAREKRDIEDAALGLELIERLRPVSFHWRDGNDDGRHYGLLAQELAIALAGRQFGGLSYDAEADRWELNYSELFAVVIRAIQELSAQVRDLKRDP